MTDRNFTTVASVVGGSACPQADDTRALAIALRTTRSTVNASRTPMDREQAAHTTANRIAGFTLAELRSHCRRARVACSCFSRNFLTVQQTSQHSAINKWTPTHKHDSSLIEWPSISPRW